MTEGYLESCGIAYRTNEFAAGRKTLVFIHGLSGSCSAWLPFEKYFEDRFNIVTFDLRGHGKSRKYVHYNDYRFSELAKDTHTLLEHLHITNYILVSHSFGTLVALQLVHDYHPNVEKHILLAPNYRMYAPLRNRISLPFLILLTSLLRLLPFAPKPGHRIDYSKIIYSPDWSWQRIYPEIRDMTLRLYLYCLQHVYLFRHDDWWEEITVPTLIIQGTRDHFVPAAFSRRLASQLQQAKLVLIENANHILVLNNIQEVCAAIEDFIQ